MEITHDIQAPTSGMDGQAYGPSHKTRDAPEGYGPRALGSQLPWGQEARKDSTMLNADVVSVQDSGDVALFTVESSEISSELDRKLMARLKKAGTRGRATLVVIDLSRVTFLGSVGIGILVRASERIHGVNGELALAGLTEHCRSVLEVCRLGKVFVLHEDVPSALEAFQSGSGVG